MGVVISFWLGFGSMTVRHKHPPLPPVSVDQCLFGNNKHTLIPSSLNYTNYSSYYMYIVEDFEAEEYWNETTEALPGLRMHVVGTI